MRVPTVRVNTGLLTSVQPQRRIRVFGNGSGHPLCGAGVGAVVTEIFSQFRFLSEVEAHDGAVAGDGYAMIGAGVAAECVGDEEFGGRIARKFRPFAAASRLAAGRICRRSLANDVDGWYVAVP